MRWLALLCALAGLVAPTLALPVGLGGPDHPFDVCPDTVDHLHIASISFDPDPIQSAHALHVTVKGRLDEAITGGSAKLTVSYYGVPVASISFDICSEFGVQCPQKAGTPFAGTISYNVPAIPLSGVTLDVQIDVKDAGGKPITCIKTQAKV
mmetsp:Transcript_28872/g.84641  ORF Transcript_28872/g.84641 Transcript_28872/m.84641 type:complete len:152 (-) Transcript_28872:373-828(-)